MPGIKINDANIFYETFGDDKPTNHTPVLLIRGTTIDGPTDWCDIAPELVKRYKVFVPDCRGMVTQTKE